MNAPLYAGPPLAFRDAAGRVYAFTLDEFIQQSEHVTLYTQGEGRAERSVTHTSSTYPVLRLVD